MGKTNHSRFFDNKETKTIEICISMNSVLQTKLICFAGVCMCNDGFGGIDCSVNLNLKPEINIVTPGLTCDLNSERCDSILIVGGPFVNTEDLVCIFEEAEVRRLKWEMGVLWLCKFPKEP